MPTGVFRYFPDLPKPPRKSYSPKQKHNQPLLDPDDDYGWLQVERGHLARVHVVPFDPTFDFGTGLILAFRVHDVCAPDGWRPAWLEIGPELRDLPDPLPDGEAWAKVEGNAFAQNQMVMAVLHREARTRPEAMLIRDLLVVITDTSTGSHGKDFAFIPND